MNDHFEPYRPRVIHFDQWVHHDDWTVKVYTISVHDTFASHALRTQVLTQLPTWLKAANSSDLPVYQQAFLILHEAREGVWILFNWWTGGEMIQTKVYFSNFDAPEVITDSPYATSSLLCVWELEVFAHERAAWIRHVLQNANVPDFASYKKDVLSGHNTFT